ncbi:MAG: hypothetical protein ABI793_09915 [Flavobacterium sp.]
MDPLLTIDQLDSGKLQEAIDAAKKSDVVIIFTGSTVIMKQRVQIVKV